MGSLHLRHLRFAAALVLSAGLVSAIPSVALAGGVGPVKVISSTKLDHHAVVGAGTAVRAADSSASRSPTAARAASTVSCNPTTDPATGITYQFCLTVSPSPFTFGNAVILSGTGYPPGQLVSGIECVGFPSYPAENSGQCDSATFLSHFAVASLSGRFGPGDGSTCTAHNCTFHTTSSVTITGNASYPAGTYNCVTSPNCTIYFEAPFPTTRGGVLALGDSVAAGYGLDIGNDYPHFVGNQLGMPAANIDNEAAPGACAAPGDGFAPASPLQPIQHGDCNNNTVLNQIDNATLVRPSLITLTVGADDIRFDGCLTAVLGGLDVQHAFRTPLVNTVRSDPCTPQNLQSNLTSFGYSLEALLQTLLQDFPGVPVVVTHYYNPLPPPVAAGGQACPLANLETISLLLQQPKLADILLGLTAAIPGSPFHGQYVQATQDIQGALYARAQYVIGALNAKIDSAVGSVRSNLISTVSLNFSGHDVCRNSGKAWAYGPFAQVSLSLTPALLPPATASFDVGPLPSTCPNPNTQFETIIPTTTLPLGPFTSGGRQLGQLTTGFSSNCFGHPTQEGQSYIASQILRHLG
jgi:hypothetical protein